jgi:hypothetical protein
MGQPVATQLFISETQVMGFLLNLQGGEKMLYNDEDKAWGTDYTVADIKALMAYGAVPTDLIEVLPGGALQVSAFVIVTMKAFTKAELGEDWLQVLRDYLHEAARDSKLNGKIKRALKSILSKRAGNKGEIGKK